MAAQSKNAGRGRTVPSQSSLLSSLLHLDLLTHLQPSLALLKSLPRSNVLSLERKEDLLCPFHLCNRLHVLSINHRLRRKSVLQVLDFSISLFWLTSRQSSTHLLALPGGQYCTRALPCGLLGLSVLAGLHISVVMLTGGSFQLTCNSLVKNRLRCVD